MPRSILKLLVPFVLLMLLVFCVWQSGSRNGESRVVTAEISSNEFDESRFLIKPFQAKEHQTALALDGGNFPVAQGQVPSIVIGKNILRTVHLAWVHDWTNPDCRAIFDRLQSLYASEHGASLPAVRIYLNPVYSDSAGKALHRAMLQVFFRSRIRGNFLILASELSAGKLSPDAEAIRQRVGKLDPSLIPDWNSSLEWLESDLNHTFSIGTLQQSRNSAILGEQSPAQLTSMLAILSPLADRSAIISFLNNADQSQRAWLQSSTLAPKQSPAISVDQKK